MEPKSGSRKSLITGLICAVLSLCFIVVAVYSIYRLGSGFIGEKKAQKEFDALADVMTGIETAEQENHASSQSESEEGPYTEDDEITTQRVSENRAVIPQFEPLIASNSDICGWIYIPNAAISYPVMWTPDDPEFYLRRDFYKNSSRSGTPFIGEACTVDSDCLIIYGHNMKNGTMFGSLNQYSEKSFWEDNPAIMFNTLYEYRNYQVFAAVTCRLSENESEGFQFYQYSGDMTEAQFNELKDWLIKHAAYDTEVMPEYGDQILMVSTCGDTYSDERFLIAAFRTPNE